jgi:Tfp pilus assembly protein PilF
MAKKLNKKIVYPIIAVLGICAIGVAILGFYYLRGRNPEYCLKRAQQAVADNDFVTAEQYYGKAYGHSKLDQKKIDILLEMAKFHLTATPKHEPNWRKALNCWNTIVNIDPRHIEARRKLLDYFYQMADGGNSAAWKKVDEYATKLLEIFEQTKQQPELLVLTASGRACLEIAKQGSEIHRDNLLDRATKSLDQLKKLTPDDVKIYEYLADAALLKGDLDEVKGVQDARSKAQKNAQNILQQAIQDATDKGTANANMMQLKLRQVQADPNILPLLRKDVEKLTATYSNSARLFSVLSACYEMHGAMDRKQELALSVRSVEKAQEVSGGQNVTYAMRIASLLYRMGSIYEEKDLTERGIKTAQDALTFPDATILPGPKEFVARQNRFMIQSFLARCFVEQAVTAKQAKNEQTAKLFYDQANKAVDEITQLAGGSATLPARQWQGMLALAENNQEQAFRLLYKVYQEMKALDKTGEMSTMDPYLCYTLSRLAATQGSMGMQREFLEKALFNNNSIAPEKPGAILDYANIMLNFQAGDRASGLLDAYVQTYGENPSIQLMQIYAAIQGGRFEDAEKRLNRLDPNDPQVIQIRLLSVNQQLRRLLGKQSPEGTDKITKDEQKKIQQLYAEQPRLLAELVNKEPARVDPQIFTSVCRRQIEQGNVEQVKKLLSLFTASHAENTDVQQLNLELAEPDPKNISIARRQELLETVLQKIKDPIRQVIMLGRHYRSVGKNGQAKELYEKAYKETPDNVEIASDYFGLLLGLKDVKGAEAVFSKIRNQNPDGYEGNLFSAQLEIARENYPAALRRLDECIASRPDSSVATMLKSQVYLHQQNYELAVENARLAFQIDPRNGTAARQLAAALYERNRNLGSTITPEQTAELQRAIGVAMVLNPDNWQLQSVYAETTQEKDPQQSLAMRQALLKSTPNVNNALMLGNMALRMAQTESDTAKQRAFLEIAGNAYQQAYQMEPANKLVQNTYAEYLRQTGQRQKVSELFAKNEEILWHFYLNDGQYAQAAGILEKLLTEKSGNIELLQGLAEAYQGMEQWEKIKIPLDQLAQQKLTADQEIWLIQEYLDAGHHEPAEKRLASFQERYPGDDRGQLLLAWLNTSQGNLEKALELVQKYLEKNSNDSSGWRLKGHIHRMMDQPQQAIDALQRSKSILSVPTVRLELATTYSQSGQIEAAIGELVGGLDEPQAPPQMWQMLESLYRNNKRFNELAKFYQQMIEKYPNSQFWYTQSGMFLLEQKNYPNAVSLLEKAWEMSRQSPPGNPSILNNYLKALVEAQQLEKASTLAAEYVNTPLAPVAFCNIAAVQAKQGQNDKAAESFSKAIEKSSGNPAMLLGTLLAMEKILGAESAEKWCDQKLAAEPKFIPAHIVMADIEEQRGAYNKAIAHVNQCLEIIPQNNPDWMKFARQKSTLLLEAYVKTADASYLEQSIQQLESNLKLQPNNATTMNDLAFLLADTNRQIDKAVDYSRQAFQASPGEPTFLDTHAYALYRAGQFTQAERYLRQAIQLHERNNTPPAWDIYKHLGMALQGQKKNKEARAAFEKALELGKALPDKEKDDLKKMIQSLTP